MTGFQQNAARPDVSSETALQRNVASWPGAIGNKNDPGLYVANLIKTTTKEPAFSASGRLSTKLATKKRDDKHA
jgi:hypothetical protein